MINFKVWSRINEVVKFDKVQDIQRGYETGKRPGFQPYNPGTFGVEIEFISENGEAEIDKEALAELLKQKDSVIEAFDERYESPHHPDIWEEDNPEPQHPDEHEEQHPEPEHPSDWVYAHKEPAPGTDEHEKWVNDKEDIISAYNEWEWAREKAYKHYDKWEKEKNTVHGEHREYESNYASELDKFVEDIIDDWNRTGYSFRSGRAQSRGNHYDVADEDVPMTGGVKEEVATTLALLKKLGIPAQEGDATGPTWGVGEDAEGIIEVRTGILTTKDIPIFLKFLSSIEHYGFDGSTSAHVHIGVPQNMDAFDLIALTTLADEDSIEQDAGEDRNFNRFAEFNKKQHAVLLDHLAAGIYDNEGLLAKIKANTDKHMGTNLLAFFKQKTVEFRYLSSQIVSDPQKLIKWIQYYLVLPKIAQSKKQIKLNANGLQAILTRLPNGQVKVDYGANKSVAQHPYPSSMLRTGKELPETAVNMISGLNFYKNVSPGVIAKIKRAISQRFTNLSPQESTLGNVWPFLPTDIKNLVLSDLSRYNPEVYAKIKPYL